MQSPIVSVLTPTYNRAKYLGRLYESLKKSSSKEFEWLIMDDGSTDDTRTICEQIINSNSDFPIRYYYQVNQGKHIALNRLVQIARGGIAFKLMTMMNYYLML